MSIFKDINTIYAATVVKWNLNILEKDQAQKLLESTYSDSYYYHKHNKLHLYRADAMNIEYGIVTPGIRASADTTNVYNRLISDVLPSWKQWPKRNNSIIFTSSYRAVTHYKDNVDGYIYNIFPYNSAKIVVCPTTDMWDAFENNFDGQGLNYIEDQLLKFLSTAYFLATNTNIAETLDTYRDYYDSGQSDVAFKHIKRIFLGGSNAEINNIINVINNYDIINDAVLNDVSGFRKYFISKMKDYKLSFMQLLDYLFAPENNGFRMVDNITDLVTITNGDHYGYEMWTNSDCLFAKENSV